MALGLTADALAAQGIPDPDAVIAALPPVEPWLARAARDEVMAGLTAAAEPAAALHNLGRLLDVHDAPPVPGQVAPLLGLLGGSPAIAAALAAEAAAWPALLARLLTDAGCDAATHAAVLRAAGVDGPLARADLQRGLRVHRRRELVRIGGRDLLGLATVDDTVRELSALADGVTGVATACARARIAAEWGGDAPGAFVVLGMGKLGGAELNYSSDIDLVYVYERDGEHAGRTVREFFARVGEEVTRALGEVTDDGLCFRVDLRLRPGGGEGPLALALAAALSYYESWGQTWERAVWLKARAVGGDHALGAALLDELSPFVYRRYLDFGTIEDLKAMKLRVDASLRDPTARERNVKLGRGGIREVEFFVQAQQLVHGGKDERLRERSTLGGLARLADAGYVAREQASGLAAAYRFLRDVEHKLQIVHQRQTQLLPADADELRALARRLGFRGPDAAADFARVHAAHTGVVHAAFDALFHAATEERAHAGVPELHAIVDGLDANEATQARLAALGFRDPAAAVEALRLVRDGAPHAPPSEPRRRALSALAPALLAEITASSHPDRALHHLASFIASVGVRTSYVHLLLENPGVRRLLVRLFATSEFLSRFFLRHPEMLDSLVRADMVRVVRSEAEQAAELGERLAAATDLEAALDALRRFRHEEFLRIGIHDIEREIPVETASAQLSTLAVVCVRAALGIARQEVLRRTGLPDDASTRGLAIVAMGKLGSGELNYNSDLDIIFVYDAGDPAAWAARTVPPPEFFSRLAQRTISALQTPTREGFAYRIDTRLRPSGNQGTLVSSFAAFEDYHRTHAALWERQALIKARVLTGPADLVRRLEARIADIVYAAGLVPAQVEEIAQMRERIERERGAGDATAVNIKTDRGGLVDVEFLAQMLQLRHGGAHPALRVGATRPALAAAAAAGLLPADDARALLDGHAFLRALESRLRIEHDQPVEALENAPEALRALARRLGYEGSDADATARFRADHARHRAAVRAAYERAFAAALRLPSPESSG